jgi:hypothetical protein
MRSWRPVPLLLTKKQHPQTQASCLQKKLQRSRPMENLPMPGRKDGFKFCFLEESLYDQAEVALHDRGIEEVRNSWMYINPDTFLILLLTPPPGQLKDVVRIRCHLQA